MEILTVHDLSFTYPDAASPAVKQVGFSVQSGEFLVLCGPSGGGKTTLLRSLKRELAPKGERSGEILFRGTPIEALDSRTSASKIGYVLQSPEEQIVTDKVWHELAFGLENLGVKQDAIRLRVGEMANYFGITSWFRRETATLSGGQKQLLNLASVMAMSPELLLLDEPTSQLDPIAAATFLETLSRLNRELGITVILSEHRLEDAFPMADRVLVLDGGEIRAIGTPRRVCAEMRTHPLSAGFPSACRIWQSADGVGECPLTVREGREWIHGYPGNLYALPSPIPPENTAPEVISMQDIWFRYERKSSDILRGAALSVRAGEIFCLLGDNGAGKTTTLKLLAGLVRSYRGKTLLFGRPIGSYGESLHRHTVAMLPQAVRSVFLRDTVRQDLAEICRVMGEKSTAAEAKIAAVSEELGISGLLDRHPYDLSGGEQQRAALAKILLTEPRILLLDEPTKGVDAGAKETLMRILRRLAGSGMTVLAVTHDLNFAAAIADRVALFFDGEILSPASPRVFFSGNTFYTTAASRISRDRIANAVTPEQVTAALTGIIPGGDAP